MKKTLIVSLVVATSCFALSRPTQAQAQTQTRPQITQQAETAVRSRGLWMEFKLGAWAGFSGLMVVGTAPAFAVGYKLGRVVVAAEVGLSWAGSESDGSASTWEYQSVGVSVVPQVQVEVARRGPVTLYLLGGCGVGFSRWKYPSSGDQQSVSVSALLQLGVGARYFLHPRFALGAEFVLDGRYSRVDDEFEGDHAASRSWSAGIHGALTAAVVF